MQNMIYFGQCEKMTETDKAAEFSIGTDAFGKEKFQWFPKSVIQIDVNHGLYVKKWFCNKNGINPKNA